ncbi:MAG: tetratricopeptide repeat protein [Myxococcota bacterium]
MPGEGASVGRYVVLNTVGRGGMGVVLAAFDPELDRKVAIKLLQRADGAGEKASAGRSRMLREAQALARLSDPNVVSVHDVGLHDGRVFIAMEFVAGETIAQWLARERPPWSVVVDRYLDAGRGLAAAHAAGLVHRDFKPHNVLIGDDGRVRVTDFGLARARSDAVDWSEEGSQDSMEFVTGERSTSELALDVALTRTGDQVGTPAYMAPEQFRGVTVDPRADQFSFCVAVYEGIYGERPFGGRTAPEIARRISRGRVRSPPSGRGVPSRVRRALLRGLNADPDERYPTMDSLLEALRREPFRRARRVAFVVLPPIALGAWWWGFALQERDSCSRVASRLSGIWDTGRKAEINKRFARTGLPYANETWQTVQSRVDAMALAWVGAQERVCHAAERGLSTGSGRAMTCLHRRFEELRSYSDLLATADSTMVEHAVSTLEALGAVADCDGTRPLATDVPVHAQRSIAEALASARVLGQAGRYDAAVEAAEVAHAEAQQVDDRWLVAEATFELARVQEAAGRLDDAQRGYHDAFSAGVAARHDEVVLRAAMSVAALAADRDKDFDTAENWNAHAEGALERMGDAGKPFAGQLDNARGRLAHGRGDYRGAQAAFERALSRRAEALGEDSPLLASYHVNLGHALARQARYSEAVEHMHKALVLEEAEYGRQHPRVATTLAALCSAQRDAGEIDAAVQACQRAVAILTSTVGRAHTRTGTAFVNLGAALADAGRADEAAAAFIDALTTSRVAWGEEHPQTAVVLNNLSVHHQMNDELVDAERYGREALAIFTAALGPAHPTTAAVAANLANVLGRQGEYDEAETILRRNIEVLQTELGPKHPDLALALGMLGQLFVDRGDAAGSLPYLERTLSILEGADGRPLLTAAACFALGSVRYEVKGDAAALALVGRARRMYTEVGGRANRVAEIDAWLAEFAPDD